MRQAWAASIPKAYAFTDKPTNNGYSGAIIAPPPPVAIFEKWIAMVSRPHVTEKQHKEQAKRQEYRRSYGKPGRRKQPDQPASRDSDAFVKEICERVYASMLAEELAETGLEVISYTEAKKRGLKHYFTGEACPYGHVSERAVNNGACVECARIANNKWHARQRELAESAL